MRAQTLINDILKDKIVVDDSGKKHYLHSNIDINEYKFIQNIVEELKPRNSIEIGCAYGISSIAICSAFENNSNQQHVIIDPYQSTVWNNIGISNLKKAGLENYKLIELPSEIALPQLLESEDKFEFGLLDGLHTFDQALVDFYYLNRLIKVGGVIVFDDISWPSINKLTRYILNNYGNYELIDRVKYQCTFSRIVFEWFIKTPFSIFSRLFPNKLRDELFSNKTIQKNSVLKLNSSMIALKKVEKDSKTEKHFKDF